MKNRHAKQSLPKLYSGSSQSFVELPGFDQLIPEWIKIQRQYFYAFEAEFCETSFGYRERPQVSLLGAAVFLCGGVCLQEWPIAKKKSKRLGRNDLWFKLNTHEYISEAKFDWIGLEKKTEKRFKKLVKCATDSTKKLASKTKAETPTRLAIAFASLTFPNKKLLDADIEREKFISLLNESCKKHKIQGWAAIWVNASAFFSRLKRHKGHTAVGLVMLIKALDHT